jgi:hypothetical protein
MLEGFAEIDSAIQLKRTAFRRALMTQDDQKSLASFRAPRVACTNSYGSAIAGTCAFSQIIRWGGSGCGGAKVIG